MGGEPILRTAIVVADGIPAWLRIAVIALTIASIVVLAIEVARARQARRWWVIMTGIVSAATLALAVLRPHRMRARELSVAPSTLVLLDRSRSMALSSDAHSNGRPRIEVAEEAVAALRARIEGNAGGRVEVMAFGAGPSPIREIASKTGSSPTPTVLSRTPYAESDLASTLRAVASRTEDAPGSVIVVSDGRVDLGDVVQRPIGVAVSAVAIGDGSPPDAAIRDVRLAGAAIAHQPIPLRIEVTCTGGLSCGDLNVTVRELREAEDDRGTEAILATGVATVRDGTASLELPITLERAGTRALEIVLAAPSGDAIPDNDRRLVTVDVARERVRILHIAGRPTYDVRALRTWLKSDAAIDVVSFFILRTPGDDVNAPDDELALIPFPVKQLFTESLPSFDAVVLQDFDAAPYQMVPYLENLASYVEHGGGLVHIGGPEAFGGGRDGGYAGTALARVTPVDIPPGGNANDSLGAHAVIDTSSFVPVIPAAGRFAPVLSDFEAILGDDLPELQGTSVLGDVHPGSMALWVHPRRLTATGHPMPVLAIGDVGDGRSVALGVDSSDILAFSPSAVATGGRAYDALFRGLIGWLMRDPRYEPVRARLVYASPDAPAGVPLGPPQPCLAGAPAALRIDTSPVDGPATVRAQIGNLATPRSREGEAIKGELQAPIDGPPPHLLPVGTPPAGGYALRVAIGPRGTSPTLGALATRSLSVCERGGDEWADPRPDRAPLEAIAHATGGVVATPSTLGTIPSPTAAIVTVERTLTPILPAWAWSALAALALGAHWFSRRRSGLS